jgi:hypothetical protein
MLLAFIFVGGVVLFFGALELLRRLGLAFGAYKPELHYMRGPGPKWHEKHASFRGRS